jgi:hypothetical protein
MNLNEVGVLGCEESVEKPGKMSQKRGNVGCEGKLFKHRGVKEDCGQFEGANSEDTTHRQCEGAPHIWCEGARQRGVVRHWQHKGARWGDGVTGQGYDLQTGWCWCWTGRVSGLVQSKPGSPLLGPSQTPDWTLALVKALCQTLNWTLEKLNATYRVHPYMSHSCLPLSTYPNAAYRVYPYTQHPYLPFFTYPNIVYIVLPSVATAWLIANL